MYPVYDREYFEQKSRQKIIQAEKKIEQIHSRYPDIKELDELLNELTHTYRLYKIKKQSPGEIDKLSKKINQVREKLALLLNKYGLPANYKEPEWDCQKCRDLGKVYRDGKYHLCSCAENHYKKRIRETSGLPKKLTRATFATMDLSLYSSKNTLPGGKTWQQKAREVYNIAFSFSKNFEPGRVMRGMIIEGPVGSGKSFLLGCIANLLLERGIPVKYIVYGELLRKIRASFDSSDMPTEDELIGAVESVPVLLIDDLGTENITEFSASVLYQIIDKRYREELPLIVTTNHSLDELKERFSIMNQRIFQRLLEMCRYVELVGNVRNQVVENLVRGEN